MLEPKYFVLQTLFAERVFRIPHYQRFYSWGSKQREDLFSDLQTLAAADSDQHHFMATLVCFRTPETRTVGMAQYRIYDVVDGQQRLTTLILLLKCIELAMAADSDDRAELHNVIVKRDDQLILLQTNNSNELLFNRFLRDGTAPSAAEIATRADENLAAGMAECHAFVAQWQTERPLADLLQLVMTRLGFVVYDTQDERAVYTVFEVLNSRGLAVDWLDKCKSMLMGRAFEMAPSVDVRTTEIHSLQAVWGRVYEEIAREDVGGDYVLRITATLFHGTPVSKPRSAEDSLEVLRTEATEFHRPRNFSARLLTISRHLTTLAANTQLGPVTDILHSRILAVALLLAEGVNEQERGTLLDQWERTTFRIFGLHGRDARHKVGDYVKLAARIVKNDPAVHTFAQILAALKELGDKYPIDKGVATGIANQDCYGEDVDLCRYVLWRYEEHLATAAGANATPDPAERAAIWRRTANDTVEHIFPQSGETAVAWRGLMRSGGRTAEPAADHVGRIGNLVLLPKALNSQASARPFAEKKQLYAQHNLRSVQEVVQAPQWTLAEIEEREKRILDWAKRRWADV
jgi:hypothetical protein